MSAKYYSGWTHEQDMELVETVLRNIRQGKTIYDACAEYEEKTNGRRSISATKYRFHTQLKEKYAKAYELAKQEGRKFKAERKAEKQPIQPREGEITIDDIAKVVREYKKQQEEKGNCDCENEVFALNKENKRLKEENDKLRVEMEELQTSFAKNVEQQKQIMDALKILESAGIKMDLPKTKYVVNKHGIVETI